MSKAFTREGDENVEDLGAEVDASIPGGKNYITPAGAERMRQELPLTSTTPGQ